MGQDYSGGRGLIYLALIGLAVVGLILFAIGDLFYKLWSCGQNPICWE